MDVGEIAMRTFLAFTLALIVVGGCTSPSASAKASAAASAQQGAENLACSSLAALKLSVDVLRSLDPATTSKDTYKAAVDGVLGTWEAVRDSMGRLRTANANLVLVAGSNLTKAFQAQPTDMPIASAAAAVKPEAEQLASAIQKVNSDLGCT
jgi:hypothetical protein